MYRELAPLNEDPLPFYSTEPIQHIITARNRKINSVPQILLEKLWCVVISKKIMDFFLRLTPISVPISYHVISALRIAITIPYTK